MNKFNLFNIKYLQRKQENKMANYKNIRAEQCVEVCVEKYIECTQRKYTGCVEEIRVCREACSEPDGERR